MAWVKYYIYKKQISNDSGETWVDTDERVPSGSPISVHATLDECEYPPIEIIDMTGKCYVARRVDGSYYKNYNCQNVSCTIVPEGYTSQVNLAITNAYLSEFRENSPYIYIGGCNSSPDFHPYALSRGGMSIYFAGYDSIEPQTVYTLARGLFQNSHIREVVLADSDTIFGMDVSDITGGEKTFGNAGGDIHEIMLRLSSVGTKAFFEGEFGDSATFGRHVTLAPQSFSWTSFKTITFNRGFEFYTASSDNVANWNNVFGIGGNIHNINTIILNGFISDYPDNTVNYLESYGLNVVDNRL